MNKRQISCLGVLASIAVLMLIFAVCVYTTPTVVDFLRYRAISLNTPEIILTLPEPNKSSVPSPIPGLTYKNVVSHLSQIGIKCEPFKHDGISYFATCEGEKESGLTDISVDVVGGDKAEDIYVIMATVFQYKEYPSDQVAIGLLGYVASIPYTNAEPKRAFEWVERNLSKVSGDSPAPRNVISGVIFYMPGLGGSIRNLSIGQYIDESGSWPPKPK